MKTIPICHATGVIFKDFCRTFLELVDPTAVTPLDDEQPMATESPSLVQTEPRSRARIEPPSSAEAEPCSTAEAEPRSRVGIEPRSTMEAEPRSAVVHLWHRPVAGRSKVERA